MRMKDYINPKQMEEIDILAFKISYFRGNFDIEIVVNWKILNLNWDF